MDLPEQSHFQNSTKRSTLYKASSTLTDGFLFFGGSFLSISLVWALISYLNYIPTPFETIITKTSSRTETHNSNSDFDSPELTFYDDPNLSYSLEQPFNGNWDEKRKNWLKYHPSFASKTEDRVLLVTGSQFSACQNPVGDHLLLRFFKNKLDYCRIHNYDIFYNNLLLHPNLTGFWAKYPIVRAAMLAHPEAEWIWWVDSDAIFTDMEFKLPFKKYENHNLVVHGWSNEIYDKKSWTGLNAGVFLIRNCQWSMDLIDKWASMGPQSSDYEQWGQTQRSMFKDKLYPESDDQSALIYLLLKEGEKWAGKIYLESDYNFEGYWLGTVDKFDNITKKYMEIEKELTILRRRHAEKVSGYYGELREQYLKEMRRPFVTHFTGCEPCTGDHNPQYTWEACWNGMQKALTFADNQVLRTFGFVHQDLNSSSVSSLPFDFPKALVK